MLDETLKVDPGVPVVKASETLFAKTHIIAPPQRNHSCPGYAKSSNFRIAKRISGSKVRDQNLQPEIKFDGSEETDLPPPPPPPAPIVMLFAPKGL